MPLLLEPEADSREASMFASLFICWVTTNGKSQESEKVKATIGDVWDLFRFGGEETKNVTIPLISDARATKEAWDTLERSFGVRGSIEVEDLAKDAEREHTDVPESHCAQPQVDDNLVNLATKLVDDNLVNPTT